MSDTLTPRMQPLDIQHKRFGSLTAMERHESDEHGKAQWFCICDCGGGHIVRVQHLLGGRVTHCPDCPNASPLHIEVWYHVTIMKEGLAAGFKQGSAGFCVVTQNGTSILAPMWTEAAHNPRRPTPVLLHTLRRLAEAGRIKTAVDAANLNRWLKRNRSKIKHHSHNEGHAVWAAWFERTGEWRGPSELKPVNR